MPFVRREGMEGSIRQIGNTILSQRRALRTLTVITLFLVAVGFVVTGKAHAQDADPDDFVDGEVVVKLDRAKGTTLEDVYGEHPEVDRTRTEAFLASSGIYLLRLQEGSDTERVAEEMEAGPPSLIYAELNYTTDAPEDSRYMRGRGDSAPTPTSESAPYKDQYAVDALNLPQANNVNKGAGTTVAVLDTGAQLDHSELRGSLVRGYDFIEDIGDTNGPTDEPNRIDDDNDGNVDEAVGHGTHVAGIVHLTAPDAKIMPMRVLDSDGRGNIFVIAEAVQRAVDPDGKPGTDDGVGVINMSLSSSRGSNLIRDVSEDLEADDDDDDDGGDDDDTGPALSGVPTRGVTVVGSAGNDDAEQRAYPAAEEGVIGVASVDQDEKKSDFSNYFGSPEVDVSAPGDDIYSLFPTDQYAEWDGTSMAAPFVAGQAALIRSMRPNLPSTGQSGQPSVTEFITTTASSIDEANKNTDWAGKLGAGHADVYKSTLKANTTPAVSLMRPVPGSKTRDRSPLISATVRDYQTNLAKSNLKLYLDGREIGISSYDTGTDRMSRAVRLSPGSHTVRVTARDAQGFSATRTWRFRIV